MGDEDTQQLHKTTVKERFIQFLPAPIRPALEATLEMAENITGVTSSGFSDIACSVQYMRRLRDDFLKDQILKAVKGYQTQETNARNNYVKSAINLLVYRESNVARREER